MVAGLLLRHLKWIKIKTKTSHSFTKNILKWFPDHSVLNMQVTKSPTANSSKNHAFISNWCGAPGKQLFTSYICSNFLWWETLIPSPCLLLKQVNTVFFTYKFTENMVIETSSSHFEFFFCSFRKISLLCSELSFLLFN